jgi:predicted amidohydrolase
MFDLLIKGATIVDGTGGQSWVGDAAITGDRFAALDRPTSPAWWATALCG